LDPGDTLYLPPHWYHDPAPKEPSVSMTIRNAPPPESWGTLGDREVLARTAKDLFDILRNLSPIARKTYITLLRNDLDEIECRHKFDRLQSGE